MALTSVVIQKAAANFLEFQKGRMLADQNAVTEMKCDSFWRGEVAVEAQVEENGDHYWTKIRISQDRIADSSCSCAQFHREQGLCRHLAASLFHYQIYYQEGGQLSVSTSMGGRILLQKYQNMMTAQLANTDGTIWLEPRLLLQAQKAELEFRIGDKASYVMKDLREFGKRMREGQEGSYGKQLAFFHVPEAFEPFSREMAGLIVKQMAEYDYFHTAVGSSRASFEKVRRISLKDSLADDWFSLLNGRKIPVETASGIKNCLVTAEDPSIAMEIRKKGRDGAQISISDSWFFIYGLEHIYVVDEDKIHICSSDYSRNTRDFFQMTEDELFLKKRQMVFQERDFKTFCSRVLPHLEKWVSIREYGINLEEIRPQNLTSSFFLESPDGKNIVCRFCQSYGEFSFLPLDNPVFPENIRRDSVQEMRVHAVVKDYFTQKDAKGNLVIYGNEEAVFRLIKEGIARLKQVGEVFVSEEVRRMRILPMPEISVGISLRSGLLELSVDSGGLSGEELHEVLHSYREKKRWHRLKNGEFLELKGSSLERINELARGLYLSDQQLKEKLVLLPPYRAFYIDAVFRDGKEDLTARSDYFRRLIERVEERKQSAFKLPKTLMSVMREYQKEGFQWMKTLKEYGFGGILADDMGLGKTLQTIAFLLSEKEEAEQRKLILKPALVVCPASLIYNWESEFLRFAPQMKVIPVAGTARERKEMRQRAGAADVLITSYDLLRRDSKDYKDMEFSSMVIDEAQYIKNYTTQNAKAVKSIQALFRLALTGTPIENRLSELWSIFDFLMPGFLYSYARFQADFEAPIVKRSDSEALKRLHRMTGPFLMRRLKQDVLKDLPAKLEKTIYSRMEGTQKYLYQAAVLELKTQLEQGSEESFGTHSISILASLMRLRQICCDPSLCLEGYEEGSAKLNTCMELISRAVQSGHKLLLFSQFTSMLEKIEVRLKEDSISYYKITGATSKETRAKLVENFQKDPIPVFLISLKAGGTGLNLTAADIVIHYDPWWNQAAQNQATDRTHRIGQEKVVTVYQLITKDTIEDNILKLQESKKNLAEQALYADGVSLSALSRQDLLNILG
ncbi:MAG: SNF2 helicase associated domain-containing protein [Lachnospiraceae bacterium]